MKTTDILDDDKDLAGLTTTYNDRMSSNNPKPLNDLFEKPINNIRENKTILTLSEYINENKHLYTHGKGKRKKHKGKKKK